MKLRDLLDETKQALGIKSNAELARALDVSPQSVSDYYTGNRCPDDFACLQISKATGKDFEKVVSIAKADTEKDEKRREVWEKHMKRLGGVAASFTAGFFMLVTFAVTSTPLEAAQIQGLAPLHFVLC